MDSIAASLMGSGTSKSGRPIDRLIGSFIFAARSKTLRMPDASTACARREIMIHGKCKMEKGKCGRNVMPFSIYHFPFYMNYFLALAAGAAALAPAAGAAALPAAAGA